MGKLTTHVLDTANGRPGAALKVDLYALDGDSRRAIKTVLTNSDGRCDEPLLEGAALTPANTSSCSMPATTSRRSA